MRIKLRDIAAACGLSISTVSRVINNDATKPASPETARKVLDTAQRLGYFAELESNVHLKQSILAPGITIGCILASQFDSYQDPFFSCLLAGVQHQASQLGFTVGYSFSYAEDSASFFHRISTIKVDGMVLMGRMNNEQFQYISEQFPNLVYVGLNPLKRGIDEVVCDAYDATVTAMKHLLSLGHRKIGFIGPIPTSIHYNVINEYRYLGYCDSLTRSGVSPEAAYIRDIPLTTEDGYRAMAEMIRSENLPTAVFCSNDNIAIGAIRAMSDSGLKAPRDISVISINNTTLSGYIRPSLTTIDVPKEEMGRFAVRLLAERIDGSRKISCTVKMPHELIIRESTGPVKV